MIKQIEFREDLSIHQEEVGYFDLSLIWYCIIGILSYLLFGVIRKYWMIAKYQLNVELSRGEEE